ncbi:hypothetical protein C8F01DRAFT_1160702 [Mycena amicta]|nr:hypothetical protein C8F01DRAFT_1160702 [Mycena amicta]
MPRGGAQKTCYRADHSDSDAEEGSTRQAAEMLVANVDVDDERGLRMLNGKTDLRRLINSRIFLLDCEDQSLNGVNVNKSSIALTVPDMASRPPRSTSPGQCCGRDLFGLDRIRMGREGNGALRSCRESMVSRNGEDMGERSAAGLLSSLGEAPDPGPIRIMGRRAQRPHRPPIPHPYPRSGAGAFRAWLLSKPPSQSTLYMEARQALPLPVQPGCSIFAVLSEHEQPRRRQKQLQRRLSQLLRAREFISVCVSPRVPRDDQPKVSVCAM